MNSILTFNNSETKPKKRVSLLDEIKTIKKLMNINAKNSGSHFFHLDNSNYKGKYDNVYSNFDTKKDLGKDSPEEQKERTMGDNKEEENNNQVQAPDNAELIKSSIEQISNTGREVLKQVEKFKFNLEQTSRMLSQNPQLSQGMMAKRKSVNEISEKLYQIIFDIENTDISLAFQQESPEAVMDSKNDTRSVGEPKPQPNPGPVPPNPNLNNDKKQEEDEDEDQEDEDLEIDEDEEE